MIVTLTCENDNTTHEVLYVDKDFEFGGFEYEIDLNDSWNKWEEVRNNYLSLEVKSVTVTNENSKVLTNLSTEVFNQLETTYTNY